MENFTTQPPLKDNPDAKLDWESPVLIKETIAVSTLFGSRPGNDASASS